MNAHSCASYLSTYLSVPTFQDYCHNGIQVEGMPEITKIATAVTVNERTIRETIAQGCQALFVHHGLFWGKDYVQISGIHKTRLALLMEHNISLFAYHLPLDMHPIVGNNVQLIQHIGGTVDEAWSVGYRGHIIPQTHAQFEECLLTLYKHETFHFIQNHQRPISRIMVVTGGGASYLDSIPLEFEIDLFITGEIKESSFDYAQERGMSYLALGHHQSEQLGIQALGQHLADHFGVEHQFINAWNPY